MTSKCMKIDRWAIVYGLALASCLIATSARAASISYGSLAGTNVMFNNIVESSTTDPPPLYGTPTATGNALVFNPPSFGAFASNGGLDFTDGTLNTSIAAKAGQSISKIVVQEFGDYNLESFVGPSSSSLKITAPVFLRIEAVNGVNLLSPLNLNTTLTFTNGGNFTLPANSGAGIFSGIATVDVDAALSKAGISGKATRIQYTMNNTLRAFSSGPGTIAFIQKKQIGGVVITAVVPEPTSLMLISLGAVGAILAFRMKKRI